MNHGQHARWVLTILFIATSLHTATFTAAQTANNYTNLQVLDPDISREDLGNIMVQNTIGLGLPRRQREGCLYCHVGDMDLPVTEWDFASDDKQTKLKARVMLAMVRDINENQLTQLPQRQHESFSVTCVTCHSGRSDPRPLLDVLRSTYSETGIAATIDQYRTLRERYYGAGAYDFRAAVLVRFANELAEQEAWDDTVAIAELNATTNPTDPFAIKARMTLHVAKQIEEIGVSGGLAYFDRERNRGDADTVDFSYLDWVGWRIYRQERHDEALQIFRRNLALFPEEYIPNESLGDALWFAGDKIAGIAVFESWVEKNPENDMGRRRLLNMRNELQNP